MLLLPVLLPVADFMVDGCLFCAFKQMSPNGLVHTLIPQPCLVTYTVRTKQGSEARVSRYLDKLPQKTVLAASPSQLQHLKDKCLMGSTTSRVQLMTLATAIRVAQSMKLSAALVSALKAQDPCLSAAPPAAGAPAAAARAVGMSPAEAQAALRRNQAAAAAAGPSSADAGPSFAAAATPQAQASSRTAGQIPEVFPAGLPLVHLTTEELHRRR